MSEKHANHFADFSEMLKPQQVPYLTRFKSYDPFEGLPRKQIPGTHPYAALVLRRISRVFYLLEEKATSLAGWLDWQGYQASLPLRKWEGYSEVDWDKVSPEERKRRTTVTFTFGQSPLLTSDDPE